MVRKYLQEYNFLRVSRLSMMSIASSWQWSYNENLAQLLSLMYQLNPPPPPPPTHTYTQTQGSDPTTHAPNISAAEHY